MSIHAVAALVFATMMTASVLVWAAPRIAYQVKENARAAWVAMKRHHPTRAARLAKTAEWVLMTALAVGVSYLAAAVLLDTGWWF